MDKGGSDVVNACSTVKVLKDTADENTGTGKRERMGGGGKRANG